MYELTPEDQSGWSGVVGCGKKMVRVIGWSVGDLCRLRASAMRRVMVNGRHEMFRREGGMVDGYHP